MDECQKRKKQNKMNINKLNQLTKRCRSSHDVKGVANVNHQKINSIVCHSDILHISSANDYMHRCKYNINSNIAKTELIGIPSLTTSSLSCKAQRVKLVLHNSFTKAHVCKLM